MITHGMLDLVPLYALDALRGREHEQFVRHLGGCAACQSELHRYQDVAANLVHDEPASDEIWERISASITADAGAGTNVIEFRRPQPNGIWKWTAAIAAGVALVFASIVIVDRVGSDGLTGESIVAAADQLADEPGSFVGEFVVEDVSVAQVVLSAEGRGFVIPTGSLDPLDETRTYQLWVINDTEDVISAGVLGNRPEPATFTWTGEVTGFALTREVAGGVISSEGDVVSVITGA